MCFYDHMVDFLRINAERVSISDILFGSPKILAGCFFRYLALNHACRWHGWFCVLLCIFARWEQCGRHPCRCVPWFFKCLWISWTAGLKWTKLHLNNCKKFCLKSTLSSSQVICDLPGNLTGYHAIFQSCFLKSRRISAMLRSKLKSEQALSTKEPGNQFFLRRNWV